MSWGRLGSSGQDRSRHRRRPGLSQPCEISSSKPAAPATRVARAAPGSVTTATTGRLLFNDRARLSMLITVMPEDEVSALVTGLRRLLEARHWIFFVT